MDKLGSMYPYSKSNQPSEGEFNQSCQRCSAVLRGVETALIRHSDRDRDRKVYPRSALLTRIEVPRPSDSQHHIAILKSFGMISIPSFVELLHNPDQILKGLAIVPYEVRVVMTQLVCSVVMDSTRPFELASTFVFGEALRAYAKIW